MFVVPVFALANAGVPLSAAAFSDAATSPVTIGVVVGLVIGKLVGVTVASLVAVRLGAGRLPEGMTTRHLVGVGAVAGIGFTVSLFIADLAFDDAVTINLAKIGILAASVAAGALAYLVLSPPGRSEDQVRAGRSS
jgi:Na+/H+ antiporter NhaA